MSSGLLALLDDVAALAKVAAVGLDDAAAQAAKAGSKAAGIVIDDAAVTPRYVVGFASDRELPIIGKIAAGSLKNKLLFLLPGALALSLVAPWLITPLLMVGGAYLCLEGYHKVLDLVRPHAPHEDAAEIAAALQGTPQDLEDAKVESAIRTDFILSAEIMAIALASASSLPLVTQGIILAVVGVGMTALVYGAVAIIVRADDVGAAMARSGHGAVRAIGRGIVLGMPGFLRALSLVGMAAMLWVGGGILVHGLYGLGVPGPEDWIHHMAQGAASVAPALSGMIAWLVAAGISGIIGLAVGALAAMGVDALSPLWAKIVAARKAAGARAKSPR